MSIGRRSARWTGGRSFGTSLRLVGLGLVVVLLASGFAGGNVPGTSRAATSVVAVAGELTVTQGKFALSPGFFGVNVHVVGEDNQTLAGLANGTPFVSYRFSPMGEATDQVHALTYSQNGVPSPTYGQTDAQFVTWCRWVHCHATMMVPAEIDNPSEAATTVRYVEQTLGFHPSYWAIGNEPQQWTHWKTPWSKWRTTDHSTPSPAQYALEVQHYVRAMRAVDPKIRIIGIESVVGGTLADGWFKDLMKVDGPNLTAVAYHAYPLGAGNVGASLGRFYGGLTNPQAFPLNYPVTKSILRSACPTCKVSVFVDEFNSALGGNFTGYMIGYPEVPFIGAAVIAALREDASRVLFFDLEDLDGQQPYGLATVGGGPRESYLLMSTFFERVATGSVEKSAIAGGPRGVYEVLTSNSTSTSLFVINTNLTDSLSLTLPPKTNVFSDPLSEYTWIPPSPTPTGPVAVPHPAGTIWSVPPQSLLLLSWDAV